MVEVWTTGKCNLKPNCSYCFAVKKVPLDMTEEIAEATIQYLQGTQSEKVEFYGGEPLGNPTPIKMMLGSLKGKMKNPSFSVTTNGTLLKGDILDWIRYHKVSVALSFDGSKKSQDLNRSGTYNAVVGNARRAMKMGVGVNVLKVMYPLETMYDDVVKIKRLGFNGVYLNVLKPYGFSYRFEDITLLEKQYLRIVRELHRPPDFSIRDFESYAKMAANPQPDHGCGIGRQGRTIGPDGYLYPCIDGPLLGQDYSIGSVWHGVDPVRERRIKLEAGKLSDKCLKCELSCSPCNVVCFLHKDKFGVEPDEWFCAAIAAKYRVASMMRPAPAPPQAIRLEMKQLAPGSA